MGLLIKRRLHTYCLEHLLLHAVVKLAEIRVLLLLVEVYGPNLCSV